MPGKPKDNIFINCPFDKKYKPMLDAMLFTVVYCGYEPRISSEKFNSFELRLLKIKELIKKSKYSIHDLSRMKSSKQGEYGRFNMPFEIGLDYGCKVYGGNKHKDKKCLILAERKYAYQKAVSDLNGIDIASHNSKPENLVRKVRNWIRGNLSSGDIESPYDLWTYYLEFTAHFGLSMTDRNFKKKDIEEMPVKEFLDLMKDWVKKKKSKVLNN